MEGTLRKTLIRLQQGIQLNFWKIAKFNKFGCKALFYDSESKKIYDVSVLSKSLLQLNSYSELITQNLKRYQTMNSKIICPIHSVTEDGDIMYIISEAEKHKLSDLVRKREGLTQFEALYFLLDLMELMNYLKSRNMFYQALEIDQIYLSKNMKMLIPFSIWVSCLNSTKPIALRQEDKKGFVAPEFFAAGSDINADEVNSWNVGVFLYEVLHGVRPFQAHGGELLFPKQMSKPTLQLLQKLLKKRPEERLKFPLIFVQELFKRYPSLPHILPSTIFSCPPSNEYISEYYKNFHESQEQNEHSPNQVLNVRTAYFIEDQQELDDETKPQVKSFKSYKHIKASDRSLTETRSYITEYVDISHTFGYGYQMNTGLICFVFNDSSEMYFENSLKKSLTYISDKKKQPNVYVYEKLPEEGQLKKKLYILEAYLKSIKKFKPTTSSPNKVTTVSQYYRTNSAGVFLLSNQTLQIFFNDKIIVLLTKQSIHIQNKNSDKFEPYESLPKSTELAVRRTYALAMAKKLFHWDVSNLEGVRHRSPDRLEIGGSQMGNSGSGQAQEPSSDRRFSNNTGFGALNDFDSF